MKERKPERVRWEVAPEGTLTWKVRCRGVWLHTEPFQFLAVRWAAKQCRLEWQQHGVRSELAIKDRNGRYSRPRTYGDDPAETAG